MEKATEEGKKMESFLKWTSSKGAMFPKIEIRCYGKNFRGVHATAEISKGERIMTIPSPLILTESIGWTQSSLGAKIKSSGVVITYPYCTYIGCLLFDAAKDPNHPFKPYFDIFPTDASTFPFFYSGDEFAELQELSIAATVAEELKSWNDEYERIVKAVPEFAEIPVKKYIETAVLLCSRNFYCYNAPEPRLVVPLADMFNHHIEKNNQTSWHYVPDEKSFVVVANENIKPGEEIAVSYGIKSSSRFLHYYGFVPEHNNHESIPIPLVLNKADPLLETKEKLVGEKLEIRTLQFFPEADYVCYSNDKVMSHLRFIEFKGDPQRLNAFVHKPIKEKKFAKIRVPGISCDNEHFALRKLHEISLAKLTQFSSNNEKDTELLEKEDVSINRKNLAKIRIIERRLHERIVKMAEKGLELLKQDYDTVFKEYKEISTNTWFKKYVELTILPLVSKK